MSQDYTAPLADLQFILNQVLDVGALAALERYAQVEPDIVNAVLGEGARFTEQVLSPVNRAGDEHGCRFEDGRVLTPPGFKGAWDAYVAAGWPGLDLPERYGGQSLPLALQVALAEMVDGANIAFGMLPLMLRAAAHLLIEHADEGTRETVVPRLTSGAWAATICISEAQAGSDVGRIRTLAQPQAGGSYRLSGQKIFITFGDQDLTEQIVHMVLARTPGAPAGTRGLSLFLVPKHHYDAAGALGERNTASVSRVEKKMGLKASATTVLELEDAHGIRIGPEGEGLKCMFTMVNLMRLQVAVQGIAVGGAALGRASRYALERPQGGDPAAPPVMIIQHADVRRMLLVMRARIEGYRALALEAAMCLDRHRAGGEADALALAEWLLPVCKAGASEAGFEAANTCVQVFGGHGYVSDAGVEQYVRDVRVAGIYEGANGIQALDLVTRKLGRGDARRYQLFRERLRESIDAHRRDPAVAMIREALVDAVENLDACTEIVLQRLHRDPRAAEAGAVAYLQLVGLTGCAWMWLRMAAAASEDSPLHRRKRATAKVFAEQIAPETATLARRIAAGTGALDNLDAATLAGE